KVGFYRGNHLFTCMKTLFKTRLQYFPLLIVPLLIAVLYMQCAKEPAAPYDLIIQNGMIYDGSGRNPYTGCIVVQADSIVYVGQQCEDFQALRMIDAKGQAVCPGFINMLSWATES